MVIPAAALLAAALAVPQPVAAQLAQLTPVGRFAALPADIRAGRFTVDGTSAAGWQMAEPGGRFSATDVPVPNAPGRRLVFAACDTELCILHYERGGIAHFYQVLALSRSSGAWKSVWNLFGPSPLANLAAFRALVRAATLPAGWKVQWVRGDF